MGKPPDSNPYRTRHPQVTMLKKQKPKKAYFSPRYWPGYAIFIAGFFWQIIEFLGNLDFLRTLAGNSGIAPAMIVHFVLSPLFGMILMIVGMAFVIFIGEPKVGVQRQAWWPIIGWSVFGMCFTAIVVAVSLPLGAMENQEALKAEAVIEQKDSKPLVVVETKFVIPEIPNSFFDCGIEPSVPAMNMASDVAKYLVKTVYWGRECHFQLLLVKKLLDEDRAIDNNIAK